MELSLTELGKLVGGNGDIGVGVMELISSVSDIISFKYGLHIQIVMTSMENMLSWELRKCFKLEGRRDLLCQCSWRSIKMKLGKDPETNHLECTDNPPKSSFDGVVWVKA